jgi:methyl-accepting chemotaxis protein
MISGGNNNMKFSIGLKLWAGFISILLVLLVVGAISYQSIVKLMTAAQWRSHTYQVLGKNSELLSSFKDAETGQRGYLLTGEEHYLAPYTAALSSIDNNFQALKKLTADNQAQQRRLETIRPLITQKLNELKDSIELRRAKGLETARKVVLTDQGKKTMDEIRAIMQAMGDEENALLQVRNAEMLANAESTYRVIILGMLFACVLVVVAGLLLTWNISRPLKEITVIAEQIAAGDLSIDLVPSQRSDEVGVLMRTFTRMVHSLQDMAGTAKHIAAGNLMIEVKPQSDKDTLGNAFAAMVSNLRKLTLQIREGMNVLTSSSNEILATTTQVASGAAETATAVNQTTATVEEIKQAVQLANQKAKHVSDSAQKTAQVSQSGRQAVDEMIGGMARIREQTSSTAQSIVKLSEQSRAIGEIIATVKDLAEQSNLLAVNASIEASKAGEQGKGFAVVAQEIKSLAEQSRQATVQVRMILGEIQAATEVAVMATDLSGKAVELGTQQSDAAGASIQMLGDSIVEAAHAAMQIAASSQQQMVGMDQVALAMENIKQASTQNMAGTRQAEAAAQDLHELGLKLKQLVETYQV